ncbi:MAG: vitamin B12 dependent methionine synthase [Clostridiales bacterium]|nr:vitamin B12 dependent methionine synthase [Clostridiales bacterium]
MMAVTLGNDVDAKIRYYERKSITRALILDACATAAVEEICDRICDELGKTVNKENKTLTSRYSPGYGDLPIHIQNDFLSVLGAQKAIGLTANSHSILIPRKSVTAIVGVVEEHRGDLRSPANHEGDESYLKNRRGDLRPPNGDTKNLLSSEDNTCLSCKNYSTCMYRREGGRCGGYRKA